MQPAICVHTEGLAFELLEVAWFMDGFEQWKQAYNSQSRSSR